MIKLALIGRDISHSRSKEMYEDIIGHEVDYHLLDYSTASKVEELESLFERGFLGLSVTYPYKGHFLNSVQVEDSVVKKLNAINCIRKQGSQFEATNTDYLAAQWILQNDFKQFDSFLILGSGNMSRVFAEVINDLSKPFKIFSRRKYGDLNGLDYENELRCIGKNPLVINCCSRDFTFDSDLPDGSIFWDMNYSFAKHDHLKSKSLNYIDGLNLLKWQAKFALSFWNVGLTRNS